MLVANGRDKARGTRDGGLAESDTWCSVLLSTGERSMLDMARVGAAARVVELHAPFTPDAETADRLLALAQEAYGWPGRWLTAAWPLPTLPDLKVVGPVAKRLAEPVAACAAGFGELARMVGVNVNAPPLGQSVLNQLAEDMAERGESAGERLWDALAQDVAASPVDYPGEAVLNALADRDTRGVFKDGYLYLFARHAKTLAEDLGLDLQAAIKELVADGRVKAGTNGRGNQTRVRTSDLGPISAYAFKADQAARLLRQQLTHPIDSPPLQRRFPQWRVATESIAAVN